MDKKFLIWMVIMITIVSTISFSRSFLGFLGVIPWHYGYSDIFNEDRVGAESAKKIPYLESPIEYPVITGFFIYFAWHFGKSLVGYTVLTYLFLTLCYVITAIFLYKLVEIMKIGKNRIFWFFIFAPSSIIFGIYNWDIIAVMLMVISIYSFYRGRYAFAGIFLSLGFNAKLFPILLLPFMLLKINAAKRIKLIFSFLAAFFILNGYFIINNLELWKATYLFHSVRESNIDSIWRLTGLGADTINALSLALFLLLYLILIHYHRNFDFMALGFISVALFLLLNKIFSPQYLLWLLPFFVLLPTLTRNAFYSLEISNIIVFFSTLLFLLYSRMPIFLTISNLFVIIRGVTLIYLLYHVIKKSINLYAKNYISCYV